MIYIYNEEFGFKTPLLPPLHRINSAGGATEMDALRKRLKSPFVIEMRVFIQTELEDILPFPILILLFIDGKLSTLYSNSGVSHKISDTIRNKIIQLQIKTLKQGFHDYISGAITQNLLFYLISISIF